MFCINSFVQVAIEGVEEDLQQPRAKDCSKGSRGMNQKNDKRPNSGEKFGEVWCSKVDKLVIA